MRLPSTRRRCEDGAAAVEFALVFCFILVPLLMGMLQYGWYFFSAQSASSAAREATRRLVVGDCTAPGEAQSFASTQANVFDLKLTFGTPADDDAGTLPAIGEVLRVKVTANGKIIGFLPLPDDGLVTRVVDARVEDDQKGATCG